MIRYISTSSVRRRRRLRPFQKRTVQTQFGVLCAQPFSLFAFIIVEHLGIIGRRTCSGGGDPPAEQLISDTDLCGYVRNGPTGIDKPGARPARDTPGRTSCGFPTREHPPRRTSSPAIRCPPSGVNPNTRPRTPHCHPPSRNPTMPGDLPILMSFHRNYHYHRARLARVSSGRYLVLSNPVLTRALESFVDDRVSVERARDNRCRERRLEVKTRLPTAVTTLRSWPASAPQVNTWGEFAGFGVNGPTRRA